MAFWIASLAGLAAAYLIGSIPTAYWAGKWFYGLDIREHGSRSVGATNALRVLGAWPALAVLLVDVLKGVVAVALARWLCDRPLAFPSAALPVALDQVSWTAWTVSFAGLAALAGHSRSLWLGFSGGKSVASGFGVVLAISWPVSLVALAVFGVATAIFRIVSLGSMLAALTAVLLVCGMEQPLPYRLLVVAGGLYIVARHRANIQRLLAGTEPRLGRSPGR